MVITQYPHTVTFTFATGSVQDANGNWVAGGTETKAITGRAEPNGGGRLVQLADGSQVVYSWTVYMPKGTPPVPDGTQVDVTWNGAFVGKGKSLRFSQGQLNSRLWL